MKTNPQRVQEREVLISCHSIFFCVKLAIVRGEGSSQRVVHPPVNKDEEPSWRVQVNKKQIINAGTHNCNFLAMH